jgi:PAS domain S-box-containing protein
MDNSPLAVIEFDAQLRVSRWSKEAEKVFGWTAAEVLGRYMYDIPWVHDEDMGRVRQTSQGMLDHTGPRKVSKNRNHRKDGSVIFCEWYNSAIYDDHGNLASVLSQVLDVTDRRRSEERLREAQKMESIGLLAAGLAHDFNNLLVGVIGNASLATKLLAPGSPVEDLLGRIINSGEQAAHLTKQMLAYSGKGRLVVEPIDLSDVVLEVTDLVSSIAPKRIAIQLDLKSGLSAIVADRSQIHQVLMNLVINATEAIGNEAGLISIQTGIQGIDGSILDEFEDADISPGRYVFLEVRDSGCGIDEATKSKVFDPFFTTKFLGRGLGLAAVAGIVRAHKGAIRIQSAPGQGTAFRVVFPATDSKPAPRATRAGVETQKDYRIEGPILVVDDEESVRNVAKRVLEMHGCTVLTAGSGSEASAILRQNRDKLSLVILDLNMPAMSGLDELPELLAISPGVDVVVSSGYPEAEAMSLFTGMPVAGFIQKPYTIQRLMEQVDRVLNRKRS